MKNTLFLIFSLISVSALYAADGQQSSALPKLALPRLALPTGTEETFQAPSVVGLLGGTFFAGRVIRDIAELNDTAEEDGSCNRLLQKNPRYYLQLALDVTMTLYCFCGSRS
jgi:hypothetical protein